MQQLYLKEASSLQQLLYGVCAKAQIATVAVVDDGFQRIVIDIMNHDLGAEVAENGPNSLRF